MQKQKARFEDVNFYDIPIIEISPDIENLCRGFKCLRHEFALYISGNTIKLETQTSTSKCWIMQHDGKLIGYITLLADKLIANQPILIKEGVKRSQFPAIKIGWLATDRRAKGTGVILVTWAINYIATEIAKMVGVRFVTVDALYDKDQNPHYNMAPYYAKLGFNYVNEEEQDPEKDGYTSMYFDLMPILLMNDQGEINEHPYETGDSDAVSIDDVGE